MDIRAATPGDLDGICALHLDAFTASAHGHHGEADLVRWLHDDGDAVASLCAWREGVLIGHVLFSPMMAEADGVTMAAAALAPLAVRPEHRGKGVATELVRTGHDALVERGV